MNASPDSFAIFREAFYNAIRERIEELGGQAFLDFPAQERTDRIRDAMIGIHAFCERGFWYDVLVNRTNLKTNKSERQTLAAGLHHLWGGFQSQQGCGRASWDTSRAF